MKFRIIITVICCLLSSASIAQVGFKLELVHEGESPISTLNNYYGNNRISSGNLRSVAENCMAVTNENQLNIFSIDETGIKLIFADKTDFRKIRDGQKSPAVVACNIDNDNLDELIVGTQKTICIYKWDGARFNKKTIDFPYYIYQMTVGDIMNDGEPELVIACLETPSLLERDGPNERFRLVIAKFQNDGLETIYDNNEKKVITFNIHQPPGRFECITDYYNIGINQLVTTEPQSDMSSTQYKTTYWDSELKDLILSERFNIPGFNYSGGFRTSEIIGDIVPVNFGEESFFLATSWANERGYYPDLYLMKNDNGKYLYWKLLELPWGTDVSNRRIIALKTNNNTGILLLNEKRVRRPSNYLYQYYILEKIRN